MSKKTKTFIVIIILSLTSGMILFLLSNYSILNLGDFVYWYKENMNPAISIPETGEKYYSKWQCFRLTDAKITEVTLDYATSPRILPIIELNDGSKKLEFDIDPNYNWNKDQVVKKWSDLIQKQEKICIFAAFLQKDPDLTSVWMIIKIKTSIGEWDISENSRYSIR